MSLATVLGGLRARIQGSRCRDLTLISGQEAKPASSHCRPRPPGITPSPRPFALGSRAGWHQGLAVTLPCPWPPGRFAYGSAHETMWGNDRKTAVDSPGSSLPARSGQKLGSYVAVAPVGGPGTSGPHWHLSPALSPVRASLQLIHGRSSVLASP